MTNTVLTSIDHPGSFIKEELEARGWIQRDLAFVLGCNEQALNAILTGKRGISPEMAKALGDAFDVPAEFFANLQQAYDMAQARNPYPGVAERGKLQSIFPVREMILRNWLAPSNDTSMLEAQMARFFETDAIDKIPYMPHAARRRYEDREIPPSELAWLFRVRQIAKSISVPAFSDARLRKTITEFESLLMAPEEVRNVPRMLAECGVRFILVEKLPKATIDGVCFWLGDSPVIGMSTQRDKIDNFWFVLRHECEHILRRDGRDEDEEVVDFSLTGEHASSVSSSIPEQERIANAAASDFCVPSEKLTSFIERKKPFYSEKDMLAFARVHRRHPGIVIGQFQKRTDRWDYLTRHLVKVRHFITPYAYTDGWGRTAPVTV